MNEEEDNAFDYAAEAERLPEMVDIKAQEAWQGRIQARRAALAEQSAQARLQYADLEEAIKQQQAALAALQRNLDAMYGGMQELGALLGEEAPG